MIENVAKRNQGDSPQSLIIRAHAVVLGGMRISWDSILLEDQVDFITFYRKVENEVVVAYLVVRGV